MKQNSKTLSKKRWGRRVATASSWALLNCAVVFLRSPLSLDISLCEKFLDISGWIAGLLILGLTGTDAMHTYRNGGNLNEFPVNDK